MIYRISMSLWGVLDNKEQRIVWLCKSHNKCYSLFFFSLCISQFLWDSGSTTLSKSITLLWQLKHDHMFKNFRPRMGCWPCTEMNDWRALVHAAFYSKTLRQFINEHRPFVPQPFPSDTSSEMALAASLPPLESGHLGILSPLVQSSPNHLIWWMCNLYL